MEDNIATPEEVLTTIHTINRAMKQARDHQLKQKYYRDMLVLKHLYNQMTRLNHK